MSAADLPTRLEGAAAGSHELDAEVIVAHLPQPAEQDAREAVDPIDERTGHPTSYSHPPLTQAAPDGWVLVPVAMSDEAKRPWVPVLVFFKQHGWLTVQWGMSHWHDEEITPENGIWMVDDFKHGPYAVRGYNDGDDTHWTLLPPAPPAQAVVDYLASQPPAGAEPVAWRRRSQGNHPWSLFDSTEDRDFYTSGDRAERYNVQPLYTHPAPVLTAVDIDGLAQEIRSVDGSNSLGAGALAEALWPFVTATSVQPDSGGVEALREAWSDFEDDHLTDGKGYATRAVYDACRAAFYAASPQGPDAAKTAALAALAPVAAEGGEKDKLRIAVEALEQIKEVGSHTETRRIGDAYSDNGWDEIEVVSEEAKIATEALSALRTEPTGGGEGA